MQQAQGHGCCGKLRQFEVGLMLDLGLVHRRATQHALALAAKQTPLQITDLGMSLVELSKKRRLALPGRFL